MIRQDPDGSMLFEDARGARIFIDANVAKYLDADAPEPNQPELDAMLSRAHRARVTRESANGELLLEIRDRTEVASLADTIRIADGQSGHCLCDGDPHIAFYDDSGTRLAVISVHHGKRIRWDAWYGDARLLNGTDLLEWLASRGASQPLVEYDGKYRPEIAIRARWEAWHRITPDCLKPLLETYREVAGKAVYVPSPARTISQPMEGLIVPRYMAADAFAAAVHAMDAEYPDSSEQARLLFGWLGQGFDTFSGFPVFEEVPEFLLLRLPFDALVGPLTDPYRSDAMLEGAARFFAGWLFRTYRSHELARIPEEVRQELRDVGNRSVFPDRLERVASAFG